MHWLDNKVFIFDARCKHEDGMVMLKECNRN